MMKYSYTILYVPSVEKALDFYHKAFGFEVAFLHESKQYAELRTGETKLAFASDELGLLNGLTYEKNTLRVKAPGFEIAFVSEDVPRDYKKAIDHGAEPLKEPSLKSWGQTVAYVKDLNGIMIEICSPMNS